MHVVILIHLVYFSIIIIYILELKDLHCRFEPRAPSLLPVSVAEDGSVSIGMKCPEHLRYFTIMNVQSLRITSTFALGMT